MAKICELCKTENDDENQFCDKCGNPLAADSGPADISEEEAGEEGEAAKPVQKGDMKLMLIPLLLILILGGVFAFFHFKKQEKMKQARQVVEDYLNLVKQRKYSEALKVARGEGLNAEWETAFNHFLTQLTPDMPENDKLYKAKVALAEINEGIDKYYSLNRRFPADLKELTPVILPKLPDLPAGEYGYEYDDAANNFTIFVKGNVFEASGLPENFPAFSKAAKLQSPGEKRSFGDWTLKSFEIGDVSILENKASVNVKETAQFGPGTRTDDVTYYVVLENGKWKIGLDSSNIDPFSFSLAFTSMENISGPAKPDEKSANKTKLPLGLTLISFAKMKNLTPKALTDRRRYQLRNCREAMNKIARSLRKFSRDNDGKFPLSIQALIPNYIDGPIPINPAALEDTFSESYEVNDNRTVFTFYSKGEYYKPLGLEDNFPLYSSVQRYVQKSSDIKAIESEPEPEPTDEPGDGDENVDTDNPDNNENPDDADKPLDEDKPADDADKPADDGKPADDKDKPADDDKDKPADDGKDKPADDAKDKPADDKKVDADKDKPDDKEAGEKPEKASGDNDKEVKPEDKPADEKAEKDQPADSGDDNKDKKDEKEEAPKNPT